MIAIRLSAENADGSIRLFPKSVHLSLYFDESFFSFVPAMIPFAPLFKKLFTMARPMLPLPPVMKATFPFSNSFVLKYVFYQFHGIPYAHIHVVVVPFSPATKQFKSWQRTKVFIYTSEIFSII